MILQICLTLPTYENMHHQKLNFQNCEWKNIRRMGKKPVSNFEVLANCTTGNQTSSIFPDGKYIYGLHLGYLVLC